jgi:O-antigen/teichoic acid export membrane protein
MTSGADESAKAPQSDVARFSWRLILDLGTGYLAVLARIGSWVVVTAVAYRHLRTTAFAALVAVRSTLTVLNYLALGLGPAVIHFLSQTKSEGARDDCEENLQKPNSANAVAPILNYRRPLASKRAFTELQNQAIFAAFGVTAIAGATIIFLAFIVSCDIDSFFNTGGDRIAELPQTYAHLVMLFSLAAVVRLLAEPLGAMLQAQRFIFLDNLVLIGSEIAFAAMAIMDLDKSFPHATDVAFATIIGALLLWCGRSFALIITELSGLTCKIDFHWPWRNWALLSSIARFAGLIALAQLADYLYAPTDYVLINHLLSDAAAIAYTPAVQIDSGLLLLVSAVGAVLLPRAADAYAQGEISQLRRIYLLGTLLSTAAMALAAAIVLIFARPLLTVWYGQDMPATRAILPLILISTVVGGSSAAGRAVLLGAGRTRAYTSAALLAGLANVILSFCFVRFMHLGLAGIVLGTVVVVVARCGIWMPWYVLRTLKRPTTGPRPQNLALVEMPISAP